MLFQGPTENWGIKYCIKTQTPDLIEKADGLEKGALAYVQGHLVQISVWTYLNLSFLIGKEGLKLPDRTVVRINKEHSYEISGHSIWHITNTMYPLAESKTRYK